MTAVIFVYQTAGTRGTVPIVPFPQIKGIPPLVFIIIPYLFYRHTQCPGLAPANIYDKKP